MAGAVSDYSGFDFERLWRGREKVTEVERALVTDVLRTVDHRRLLEVGTGFGRLLGCLTATGGEVVALDFDATTLARVPMPAKDSRPVLRVAANLYYLPFVDGAFTAATMIRVFHHLDAPVAALSEIGRVLRGGSFLLVSYTPKPSVGTLVTDVQRALRPVDGAPFRSATFSRGQVASVSSEPFPVLVGSRDSFRGTIRAAGFGSEGERVAGLEEYRFLRSLPGRWFGRIAEVYGRAPGFPVRFALLRVLRAQNIPLPAADRILACPRCRTPFGSIRVRDALVCPRCLYKGVVRDGVVDLRYVPDSVPQVRIPQAALQPRNEVAAAAVPTRGALE